MVPKLVLQPIVENAVIHGVRDMDDNYIKIWAEGNAGELRLFVQDNGRSMDTLKRMARSVSAFPADRASIWGLFNVDSILRLHFGDEYGFERFALRRARAVW